MQRTANGEITEVLGLLRRDETQQLEELARFLAIESVGADSTRKPRMVEAAEWLVAMLGAAGIDGRAHATALHPIVSGEWLQAGSDRPTLLIYGHYDVQPVDPVDEWSSPPFEARIVGDRLVARGASDDKGQVFMHLVVLRALLEATGSLPVNVRLLVEGEEEIGSPSLPAFLREHRDELTADYAVVSDTPMFAADLPSIGYGLRGLAYLQVNVRGAAHDLHSGQFGGIVPNPLNALVAMLATLHNPDGSVAVAGFYDDVDPILADEKEQVAGLPFDAQQAAAALGVKTLAGEAGFSPLERLWMRPTLDINGITGGYGGEGAKTVIPSRASAKISCRLVPHQDYRRIAEMVTDHLERQSPPEVETEVTFVHGGQPYVTDRDHPVVSAARDALTAAFGVEPVFERDGGTIPAVPLFEQILGLRSLLLPFGLPNENKHAPNEWLSLENYRRGTEAIARLWFALGEPGRFPPRERRS